MKSVLVVEDDELVCRSIVRALGHHFDVTSAQGMQSARELLRVRVFDAVISDNELQDGTGLEVLRWLHDAVPNTRRILICGQRPYLSEDDEKRSVVEVMLIKPCGAPALRSAVDGSAA